MSNMDELDAQIEAGVAESNRKADLLENLQELKEEAVNLGATTALDGAERQVIIRLPMQLVNDETTGMPVYKLMEDS